MEETGSVIHDFSKAPYIVPLFRGRDCVRMPIKQASCCHVLPCAFPSYVVLAFSKMAARQGLSSQRSAKPQVKEKEGYVHEVSELKIPRSGTANRYFDFTIEEKERTR